MDFDVVDVDGPCVVSVDGPCVGDFDVRELDVADVGADKCDVALKDAFNTDVLNTDTLDELGVGALNANMLDVVLIDDDCFVNCFVCGAVVCCIIFTTALACSIIFSSINDLLEEFVFALMKLLLLRWLLELLWVVKKCVASFCFVVVDKLPGEVCLSFCISFFERTNLPLFRWKETDEGFFACFFGLPLFFVLLLLDLFDIPDSMLCRWLITFQQGS